MNNEEFNKFVAKATEISREQVPKIDITPFNRLDRIEKLERKKQLKHLENIKRISFRFNCTGGVVLRDTEGSCTPPMKLITLCEFAKCIKVGISDYVIPNTKENFQYLMSNDVPFPYKDINEKDSYLTVRYIDQGMSGFSRLESTNKILGMQSEAELLLIPPVLLVDNKSKENLMKRILKKLKYRSRIRKIKGRGY